MLEDTYLLLFKHLPFHLTKCSWQKEKKILMPFHVLHFSLSLSFAANWDSKQS